MFEVFYSIQQIYKNLTGKENYSNPVYNSKIIIYQLSIVNCQLSIINYQLSIVH